MVTQPMTMPAQAQAIATASVLLRAVLQRARPRVRQRDALRAWSCAAAPPAGTTARRPARTAAPSSRASARRARSRIGMNRWPRSRITRAEARQLGLRHARAGRCAWPRSARRRTPRRSRASPGSPPRARPARSGTARNSAITNAAAPITGGMIWPPVEATASTAAANGGRKPVRFISGMVIGPSTMTLATALPETVPNRLELHHRDLARAAGGVAGDRQREVHEQLPGAALLHERAEQHEQHHVGRRHAQRRAEDALGREIQLLHQHRQLHVGEERRVDEEDERGERQRPADARAASPRARSAPRPRRRPCPRSSGRRCR